LPDPPDLPEAEVDEAARDSLIESEWGFRVGTQALKARKSYSDDDPGDEGEEEDDNL
jgi:hypothetical protein